MYHIAYVTGATLTEIFTPSQATAFRVFSDFARAGHRPRIFRVVKKQCELIA